MNCPFKAMTNINIVDILSPDSLISFACNMCQIGLNIFCIKYAVMNVCAAPGVNKRTDILLCSPLQSTEDSW